MIKIAWNDEQAVKLRRNRIKQSDVADRMGKHKSYISRVLNGHPVSPKMKQLIISTVDEMVKEKKAKG